MAFTPGQGLKITPSNSPFYRPTGSKSPSKTLRHASDSTLSLRQIIGTTTSSPNGFDCMSNRKIFAHTAGAAIVVVSLDESDKASQRFYRARPTAVPHILSNPTFNPSTPTPSLDPRTRIAASLREAGIGMSPAAAASPSNDWNDTPSSKTWTARERIKAATCVSFSPDGRFLAVGETGYNPRVLIFSTAPDASTELPLAVLTEHTFGIRCVAFSPDSRYVASLGTMNDGFLHIWALNARTGSARLHSSNKCTTNVKHMTWMGSNVVTVGTRHVKVWRVEDVTPMSPSKLKSNADGTSTPQAFPMSPMPRSLVGRNCLLGSLADGVFTCVAALSRNKAVACTDRGDICVIDDSDGTQRLSKVTNARFSVTCVSVASDMQHVWVGGKRGRIRHIALARTSSPETPPDSPTPASSISGSPKLDTAASMAALGRIGDHLISIDSHHSIRLFKTASIDEDRGLCNSELDFRAHRDAVKGVKILPRTQSTDTSFFTWSSGGTVLFWDLQGRPRGSMEVEVEQLGGPEDESQNELKVVQASSDADFFISGDKYGVLRIIDSVSKECTFNIKAHGSEITDIAVCQNSAVSLIASCARDRTIQLFRKKSTEWTLVQTMDEHQGSVNRILFVNNGEKLISISSDRSVVVREFVSKDVDDDLIMAFLPVKTITLKATPVSIVMQPDQEDTITVSTIDRHVHKFDIKSGKSNHSFKAVDSESNDAVILDALSMTRNNSFFKGGILAAISTTDKSIRIYNAQGSCVDRDFGHTEGVTDMVMLDRDTEEPGDQGGVTLISTGSDGTVMVWDVVPKPPSTTLLDSPQLPEDTPTKETTAAQKPLRRVLSRSELAEFQRPSETSDGANSPGFATPTGRQSPPRSLRKKTSRYTLAQSPRLGIPPLSSFSTAGSPSPLPSPNSAARRSSLRDRSPSPPSPKRTAVNGAPSFVSGSRRPSLDARARTKSAGTTSTLTNNASTGATTGGSEFGSFAMSTEQVCRTLRAYRKKLAAASVDALRAETLRELDRELGLTVKALGCNGEGVGNSRSAEVKGGSPPKDEHMLNNEAGLGLTKQTSPEPDVGTDMIDEMAVWSPGEKSRVGSESPLENAAVAPVITATT